MFKPMTEQDYLKLERIQRDRQAKTELAFKACAELVEAFSDTQAHPLYPAYHLARQALGMK